MVYYSYKGYAQLEILNYPMPFIYRVLCPALLVPGPGEIDKRGEKSLSHTIFLILYK